MNNTRYSQYPICTYTASDKKILLQNLCEPLVDKTCSYNIYTETAEHHFNNVNKLIDSSLIRWINCVIETNLSIHVVIHVII